MLAMVEMAVLVVELLVEMEQQNTPVMDTALVEHSLTLEKIIMAIVKLILEWNFFLLDMAMEAMQLQQGQVLVGQVPEGAEATMEAAVAGLLVAEAEALDMFRPF